MRALFIAVILLAACTQTQVPTQTSEPEFDHAHLAQHIRDDLEQRDVALRQQGIVAVGIGETADLGGGLKVRPLEVLEDSRCPQNARCIWAGRVRLRVAIDGAGEMEVSDEAPAQTAHGAFELAVVSPGPWTDWPAENRPPYRFGFKRS